MMKSMDQTVLVAASTIVAFGMATIMIFVRAKAATKPITPKKIILPPVFMSTGAFMFLFPTFRVSLLGIGEAVIVGLFFSIFLIKLTKFEISEKDIYLIPSKAFILILIGLLIIRMVIKMIIGSIISFGETSGMFFILAFTMILTWRIAMLRKYYQLKNVIEKRM